MEMDREEIFAELEDGSTLADIFSLGEDDYWRGVVPDGCEDENANDNPYLAGWNMAAAHDNQIGFFESD